MSRIEYQYQDVQNPIVKAILHTSASPVQILRNGFNSSVVDLIQIVAGTTGTIPNQRQIKIFHDDIPKLVEMLNAFYERGVK